MTTGFPGSLDASQTVGDAVAAIETVIGITDTDDEASIQYRLTNLTPVLPHRTGGNVYVHSAIADSAPSNAFTVGTIYCIPFYIPTADTYVRAAVVRTDIDAAGVERIGVYSDSEGVPDALIAEFGVIPVTTTTGRKSIANPVDLPAGWCWLACCPQIAVNTIYSTVGTSTGTPVVVGSTSPHLTGLTMGYAGQGELSAGLPDLWGTTLVECAVVPLVFVARA